MLDLRLQRRVLHEPALELRHHDGRLQHQRAVALFMHEIATPGVGEEGLYREIKGSAHHALDDFLGGHWQL